MKADQNGVLHGEFQVPPNIPAGTKLVEFRGEVESRAQSTYTGRGEIRIQELRRVVFVNPRRSDPLAQTFTLNQARQLAGVDLWFTKRGTSQVRLQIRETEVGIPNQTILAEAVLFPEDILLEGNPTRFRFDPVFVEAGREYAIVVLTDDAIHEVHIAEVGDWDKTRGWVTGQPYQVGVLLSSSNAVTWTPHQNADLTFRLYGAEFSPHEREVDLGKYTLQAATDLIVLAAVHRTSSNTNVRFRISGTVDNRDFVYELQDNQLLNLPQQIDGEVQVTAILTGEDAFSPFLFPGAQLAKGTLASTGDYISRLIPCEAGDKLTATFDAIIPAGATVRVQVQNGQANEDTANWPAITVQASEVLGDGWTEYRFVHGSLASHHTRVRLVLEGRTDARPRVRNLRVVTT